MKPPHLLPEEIEYVSVAEDDANLFNMLVKIPSDLLLFFETASDDETWSGQHEEFHKKTLLWLTQQFFSGRLSLSLAQMALRSIQKHFSLLSSWIPLNLKITLKDEEIEVNSLLLGASSPTLYQMILHKCRDLNKKELELKDISSHVFSFIYEFMQKKQIRGMWRWEDPEIIRVLEQASKWEMRDLITYAEEILVRHLTPSNVTERLLLAHKKGWILLKEKTTKLINDQEMGVFIHQTAPEHLSFEFLNFRVQPRQLFKILSPEITHLTVKGPLIQEELVPKLFTTAPKLIGLDLSDSEEFHEHILRFPTRVKELFLSRSPWVNYRFLEQLFLHHPQLKKMAFCQNLQMGYLEWGALVQAKSLMSLDLSGCHQISDADFSQILRSAPQLNEVCLHGVNSLSDASFFEIAGRLNRLISLDLSKCAISDLALFEITSHLPRLADLNLSKCPSLTERGIVNAIEQAKSLQTVIIRHHILSQSFQEKIRQQNIQIIL